jgi:dihydropteroate synthase
MLLQARQFEFRFPGPPLVVGIINVTPDSFSDGGQFLDTNAAVQHALKLIAEGADIIDIGGESTRPNAAPVTEAEELRRVIPVIEEVSRRSKVPISVDTMKPGVARRAIQAGASIVNDVAAARFDPQMAHVVAESGAAYVLMHMQGTPQTMQKNPTYGDVVAEVGRFFDEGLRKLAAFGIAAERVILDVGIGFGKTLEHNLQLLASMGSFTNWNRPLLVGVSRKSFVGTITDAVGMTERLPGSLACACWARMAGCHTFRVHDVAATRQVLRMTDAIIERKRQ